MLLIVERECILSLILMIVVLLDAIWQLVVHLKMDMEKLYMGAGKTASMLGKSSTATSYANKALKVNPQSGEALMLIGDVIASSQGSCNDKMDGRSVYWLAVDYYGRAKAKDSSLAEKIGKKISSCKRQYPTIEQMFFVGLSEGASFTVPSRGEATKARARG